MTKTMEWTTIPIPTVPFRAKTGVTAALRKAYTAGEALQVPVPDGDTYRRTLNRVAGSAWVTAHRDGLRVRTRRSDDGRAVIIWLEPKPTT